MARKIFKLAAALGGAFLGLGLLAAVALRVLLPPEKLRALVVARAQAALHREVRLRDLSLGVVTGLTLKGLEVSEAPDFRSGKFLGADTFRLKVQLKPLLHRRVVVEEVELLHPLIAIKKDKRGRFNFDDLSQAPARAEAQAAAPKAGEGVAFELAVRKAGLKAGEVLWRDDASGQTLSLRFNELQAKDFSYDESSGRLAAVLQKLDVAAPGLDLDVSGSVRMDSKKLELPDLKGRLNGGRLELSLWAEDYRTAPDIKIKASLSELDVGKLLAAKQALDGSPAGSEKIAQAEPPPAVSPPASTAAPMKAEGELSVGKMTYSGAVVNDTRLSWQLSGITPDLKRLGGWAKLRSAGGTVAGSAETSGRSGLLKALLLPLTILQKVGSFLLPLKALPDLTKILFTEIVGDYVFEGGVMTIREFRMESAAAKVKTGGTVDLAAQRLKLVATINAAGLGPVEFDVAGSFDAPSIRPRLTKSLAAPALKLGEEAGKLLKGLFGR